MQKTILEFFSDHSGPFLDRLAEGITMLGESYLFIAVITLIYWTVSKKKGFILTAVFLYSSVLNNLLKILFHTPRPFEVLDGIRGKRLETATGYSFPSGHTQSAAAFFTSLALLVRRAWAVAAAAVLMLAVGISRVYLGVHWPADVLGGLVLGTGTAWFLFRRFGTLYDQPARLFRVLLILEGAVILAALVLGILDLTVLQGEAKLEDYFKIAGISLGVMGGFLLEKRILDFDPALGGRIRKLLRYAAGLAGTLLLLSGLKPLLPEGLFWDFLRYGLVGAWVTFFWPLLGHRMRLFSSAGETPPAA